MSSSNSSSKKPVAKPQVKVPAAAVPKESAKAAQPKKPAAVVPAPKLVEKAVPVKAAPAKAVPVKAAPVKAALVKAVPVKAAPKPPVEAKPKAAAKSATAAPKAKKETPETKAAAKVPEVSKRRIDTPEIQEKIRELIKLAKEQDYLTYDDINEILPNDLVDPDDVEAIMEVQAPNLDQAEARIGRVGDSLPPAGSWVTPSTNPIGSASPNRSDTTPSASGRNVPTDVAPSSPTSHS